MTIKGMLKRVFWGNRLNVLDTKMGHKEEFNQDIILKRWRNDLEQFDVVDMTNIETTDIGFDITQACEALRKPPLYDFVLKIKDRYHGTVEFLLHCYGKKQSRKVMADDGRAYIPLLDITQLDPEMGTLTVVQIIAPKSQPTAFQIRPVATAHNRPDEEIFEAMKTVADVALWYHVYIAEYFRNRPECFVEGRSKKRRQLTYQPRPVEPLHTVEVKRSVKVESSGTTETEHVGRTITCPCWTVSGHPRTLPSGKTIWIAPYKKGPERNNPEWNVSKTYAIK